MKVAYQGEPGAYSEEAGFGYFDAPVMIPQETFDDVFSAVASGSCQSGLIPIENSLVGSIHQNYDLLLRHELFIIGEYLLPVRHCLISFPETELSGIKSVISHPQALGQCAGYLRNLGVKTEPVYDTAGSVKILKSSGDPALAAIASKRAAEIYEMKVLQENIEDNPENYTRFLEINLKPEKPAMNAKTSIVFTLKNQPGALLEALRVFASQNIDLTKIESRPLVGKPWEYLFYLDFICTEGDESAQLALDQLGELALMLRLLGSYPRFRA
ncbi:MAG: prephenate dehydratase [Anaerolineales bacterium]|nr:prephenate dehydratase [Anaerolineales bacterium]